MLKVIDEKKRVRIKMEVGDIELSGYGQSTWYAIRDLAKQVDYRLFDRYLGDPKNIWPLGENFARDTAHRLNRALYDGFQVEVTLINKDGDKKTLRFEDNINTEKILSIKNDGYEVYRIDVYNGENDKFIVFGYYQHMGDMIFMQFNLEGTCVSTVNAYSHDRFIDFFTNAASQHILDTYLPIRSQF